MSLELKAEVVVVGAGVHGSSAALHLARAGKDTILLEKFPLPHARGSSHGQSRITRKANYAHPALTPIHGDSLNMWQSLQAQAGVTLFKPHSLLVIGAKEQKSLIDRIASTVKHLGETPQWADPKDINAKYRINFPDSSLAFVDPSAGILKADKCVTALQQLFRDAGGRLMDEWMVEDVVAEDEGVEVRGPRGVVRAGSVVLCPGPWAGPFLAKLGVHIPLKVERISVLYMKMLDPTTPTTIFIDFTDTPHVYCVPQLEYPGMVKLAYHQGPVVDPDKRDIAVSDELRESIKKYMSKKYPGLNPEPAIEETCLYTVTPDGEFVLDRHPKHPNIVFACGFSGTGFKIAPAIGEELCRMVLGQPPKYNLQHFKADRFTNTLSSSKL
ncbi:hypothetical protein Pmani_012475 [Petrolisthes manimaculis]|uniref:FAD dependent oxidoreductase domain-containing protein n=1 Tax=Petrolisthes manimaculis TaxID=1843537 RepID=A0AAE1PYH9_9EUCA|nr:hypothetical protein Pmani_012475 [Petrolisthes manimaculis]